ncbi:MAG: aconitate hydratase, partial [Steroidobacteraceae bacterium]
SQTIELDLGTVEPSIAGPKRPQDRIPLRLAPRAVGALLAGRTQAEAVMDELDKAVEASFPASDPIAFAADGDEEAPRAVDTRALDWPGNPTDIVLADGTRTQLDHGHVVIAAITSCTNTSNPSVMIGAALLAAKAVERGLTRKPWVKTSLAPGSRVVTDYLERAGLTTYLDRLGFNLVGYGCTTCIGNSGPLIPEVAAAVTGSDLTVCSVLSGNRNFEGRIHAQCRMNFLASPLLVVAYALAGTLRTDLLHEPLGTDNHGDPVYLHEIWPTREEIQDVIGSCLQADMFAKGYAKVFLGDERWRGLPVPAGEAFEWDTHSTYVRRPPYFDGVGREPAPLTDITDARVLVMLGDSVTTDHISPAGTIAAGSPAAAYLTARGATRKDFNSYGSRRGNHEVMIRGTFGNIRLRNLLVPGTDGGFTRDFTQPGGPAATIYDASTRYLAAGTPLLILAGKEYGSGSSRDWAAKGTVLLGVRAVIAESYERIHRSNLIGMGVLPLQFQSGQSAAGLGLTGEETFEIAGFASAELPRTLRVKATGANSHVREFEVTVRIDTPLEASYFRHGGILPYMLRELLRG